MNYYLTPLHLLCEHYKRDNLIELVEFMIRNGASVSAEDVHYWRTPLRCLCENYGNENLIDNTDWSRRLLER